MIQALGFVRGSYNAAKDAVNKLWAVYPGAGGIEGFIPAGVDYDTGVVNELVIRIAGKAYPATTVEDIANQGTDAIKGLLQGAGLIVDGTTPVNTPAPFTIAPTPDALKNAVPVVPIPAIQLPTSPAPSITTGVNVSSLLSNPLVLGGIAVAVILFMNKD